MQIMPLSYIPSLPNGTPIAAIRGTITRVGKRNQGTNSFGNWSLQVLTLRDQTGECSVVLKDRPELPPTWQNIAVIFEGGDKGMATDDYTPKDKPTERRIKVTASANMTVDSGQPAQTMAAPPQPPPAQNYAPQHPPAQHPPQPPPAQNYAPQHPPQHPPQQQTAQNYAPRQPQHHSDSAPAFLGPTIGMALNNACALILEANANNNTNLAAYLKSREFSFDLHTLASDILRVSAYLEKGNLAPSAKERPQPEPRLDQMPERTW